MIDSFAYGLVYKLPFSLFNLEVAVVLLFVSKKVAKYGIKHMSMTNSWNGYLLNSYIYRRKESNGYRLSTAEWEYNFRKIVVASWSFQS